MLGHCCHNCFSTFSRPFLSLQPEMGMIFFGLLQRREVPAPGTRDVFSFRLVHLGRSQLPSATQSPHLFTEGVMLSL